MELAASCCEVTSHSFSHLPGDSEAALEVGTLHEANLVRLVHLHPNSRCPHDMYKSDRPEEAAKGCSKLSRWRVDAAHSFSQSQKAALPLLYFIAFKSQDETIKHCLALGTGPNLCRPDHTSSDPELSIFFLNPADALSKHYH